MKIPIGSKMTDARSGYTFTKTSETIWECLLALDISDKLLLSKPKRYTDIEICETEVLDKNTIVIDWTIMQKEFTDANIKYTIENGTGMPAFEIAEWIRAAINKQLPKHIKIQPRK